VKVGGNGEEPTGNQIRDRLCYSSKQIISKANKGVLRHDPGTTRNQKNTQNKKTWINRKHKSVGTASKNKGKKRSRGLVALMGTHGYQGKMTPQSGKRKRGGRKKKGRGPASVQGRERVLIAPRCAMGECRKNLVVSI